MTASPLEELLLDAAPPFSVRPSKRLALAVKRKAGVVTIWLPSFTLRCIADEPVRLSAAMSVVRALSTSVSVAPTLALNKAATPPEVSAVAGDVPATYCQQS